MFYHFMKDRKKKKTSLPAKSLLPAREEVSATAPPPPPDPPAHKAPPPPPPGAVRIVKGPPPPGAKVIVKTPPMHPGAKVMVKGPFQLPPGMVMMKGPPPPGAKIIVRDPTRSPPGNVLMKAKAPTPAPQAMVKNLSPPPSPRKKQASPPAPPRNPPQRQEVNEIRIPDRHTSSRTPSVMSVSKKTKKLLAPREIDSESDDIHFVVEGKEDAKDTSFLPGLESGENHLRRGSHTAAKDTRKREFSQGTSHNTSAVSHVPAGSLGGSAASALSSTKFNFEGDGSASPSKVSGNTRQTSTSAPPAHEKKSGSSSQVAKKGFSEDEKQSYDKKNHTQKRKEEECNDSPPRKERENEILGLNFVGGGENSYSVTSDHGSPKNLEDTAEQLLNDRSCETKSIDNSECSDNVFPSLQTNFIQQSSKSKSTLTAEDRGRIAEQFFSILCPEQFYGKITKIHSIRLVNADRDSVTGLKKYSSIFLATKGTLPNQLFYPQLRLTDADRFVGGVKESHSDGCVGTRIVLYEAAPGNMLFAETELDARRLLKNNRNSQSCFVLEKSAIVFLDAPKHVLPVAMLTVEWIPYAAPQSEPQCPVHHKELELFDRASKELLCALCVSKTRADMSDLVIIPDVLSGDSRRRIMEILARQLDRGNHTASQWVREHQKIFSTLQSKKDAINKQFDLLVSSINSKREEYIEACEASYGLNLSSVAKEVLMADEKTRLLRAAVDHLRTEGTRPMYSMQVATVANALNTVEFPQRITPESLKVPISTSDLTPQLERVMAEVHRVSPMKPMHTTTTKEVSSHSPHYPRITSAIHDWPIIDDVNSESTDVESELLDIPSQRAPTYAKLASSQFTREGRKKERHYSNDMMTGAPSRSASSMLLRRKRFQTDTQWPRRARRGHSVPQLNRTRSGERRLTARSRGQDTTRKVNQWVALPGCRGTCVFNFPIHGLLAESCDDARHTHTQPRCLQWTLRIDDPGDWIGIGVGVGGTIETWAASRTPDLSHMWVVPSVTTRKVFVLRVSVNANIGYAKLSIHNQKGRRIDDGSIPQWNAFRSCYPQVSFGGRIGEVLLIEKPQFLRK